MHKRLAKPKEAPIDVPPPGDLDPAAADSPNANKSQVTISTIADLQTYKNEREESKKKTDGKGKKKSDEKMEEYNEDEDGESHSSSNAPPPPKDPAQLVLEQRLQSILNLIELGIIDPHESPIILNTDPNENDDIDDQLSPLQIFCIVFIVIAIVVLLVIGLIFVFGLLGSGGSSGYDDSSNDYSSNYSLNCDSDSENMGSYDCQSDYNKFRDNCDTCDRYYYRVKSYVPYIALINVSRGVDSSSEVEYCAGALINRSAVITSASCFASFFKLTGVNSAQKYLNEFNLINLTDLGFSIKVLVSKENKLSTIQLGDMKKYDVRAVASFLNSHNQDFLTSSVIVYIQNGDAVVGDGRSYICIPSTLDYVPLPYSGTMYLKYFVQKLLPNGTLTIQTQAAMYHTAMTCRVIDAWNEYSSTVILGEKMCNIQNILPGSPYMYKDRSGAWKLLGNLVLLANQTCDQT